jgi:exopolyphosphatase / guanosine-5'-triphosphate,3'-diphosphate pyrophosphatase
VENLSKLLRRRVSSVEALAVEPDADEAPGRLPLGRPIAVIDIGSNSVRLVVYEGLVRAPTPIFNEKVLCGLGREVASKSILAKDAIEETLAALARFRALCRVMQVERVHAIATAAVREAKNGPAFIKDAASVLGLAIDVLPGPREAQLAAAGVAAGFYRPDGVVGDLGGGSLELVEVAGDRGKNGQTLPLGGLALVDSAEHSLDKAKKIVRAALADSPALANLKGRVFYAVGGTWRALARLHMHQTGYPLHVTHGYSIETDAAIDFCDAVQDIDPDTLSDVEDISAGRRPLLAYGALVLREALKAGKPSRLVTSAFGVREGILYEQLPAEERGRDPLLAAAGALNLLRSRSPRHGEELIGWTDGFMESTGMDESAEEKRLRHAACLLADIGWRAHPDYRGEQSLNIIANAAFAGIDHPGRAFLALAVFYRHVGWKEEPSDQVRKLATARLLERARILGGAMRVAYLASASMPGVLPRAPMRVEKGELVLRLEDELMALSGERLEKRLNQLGKLIGCKSEIVST